MPSLHMRVGIVVQINVSHKFILGGLEWEESYKYATT